MKVYRVKVRMSGNQRRSSDSAVATLGAQVGDRVSFPMVVLSRAVILYSLSIQSGDTPGSR